MKISNDPKLLIEHAAAKCEDAIGWLDAGDNRDAVIDLQCAITATERAIKAIAGTSKESNNQQSQIGSQ